MGKFTINLPLIYRLSAWNWVKSKVLKDDEVTTKIINVMITNLYELEKVYPKNIKIKEENNE